MYNDLVNIAIDLSFFPVAKLRHYFESCISYLWKMCKGGKIGNCYKSMNYEKSYTIPYGKFPAKVWKRHDGHVISTYKQP